MQSVLLRKTYICQSDLERKKWSVLKYANPYVCRFIFEPSWDQRWSLKNQPPLSSKETTNTDTMHPRVDMLSEDHAEVEYERCNFIYDGKEKFL